MEREVKINRSMTSIVWLVFLLTGCSSGSDPSVSEGESASLSAEPVKEANESAIVVHPPLIRGMEGLFGQGFWLSTEERKHLFREACAVGDALVCWKAGQS